MKKIFKIVAALAVVGFTAFNFTTGVNTVSKTSDLSLENLDALNASAGYWECQGTNKEDCTISNGSTIGKGKGPLSYVETHR